MPDSEGKLTPEDKEKVRQWLANTGKAFPPCPFCSNTNWGVADHLVAPITLGKELAMQLGGGRAYPQVMLISSGCGHTVYFNAVMIGLVPSVKSAEAEKKA